MIDRQNYMSLTFWFLNSSTYIYLSVVLNKRGWLYTLFLSYLFYSHVQLIYLSMIRPCLGACVRYVSRPVFRPILLQMHTSGLDVFLYSPCFCNQKCLFFADSFLNCPSPYGIFKFRRSGSLMLVVVVVVVVVVVAFLVSSISSRGSVVFG